MQNDQPATRKNSRTDLCAKVMELGDESRGQLFFKLNIGNKTQKRANNAIGARTPNLRGLGRSF